jgi:hypothetical protein
LKNILFIAITIALCLNGCQEQGRYIPVESDFYKVQDKEIIYETDTLKLVVSSEYVRAVKEQYTLVEIIISANNSDIQAYFGKMELHPDKEVQKNYITEVDNEGVTENKRWILKKGKEYHFYVYFTIEHNLLDAPGAYIKNIGFNMSKVFQHNNKPLPIPEFYFASEK